jgi:hypothetical protein
LNLASRVGKFVGESMGIFESGVTRGQVRNFTEPGGPLLFITSMGMYLMKDKATANLGKVFQCFSRKIKSRGFVAEVTILRITVPLL